jgi:hypothetical protein
LQPADCQGVSGLSQEFGYSQAQHGMYETGGDFMKGFQYETAVGYFRMGYAQVFPFDDPVPIE